MDRNEIAQRVFGKIWASNTIWQDFNDICSFGGRRSGTESEKMAAEFLATRLAKITGGKVDREEVPFNNWNATKASLTTESGKSFPLCPLLFSVSTPEEGLTVPLLDLGRATPDQITAAGDRVKGAIILARHEYMVGTGRVHRMKKYAAAKAAGAAGFVIAYNHPGETMVSGSVGKGGSDDIPSAGVTYETGEALARENGKLVTLNIQSVFTPASAENLFATTKGQSDELVVLSSHIDGHALASSAIDNATGLACVLAVTEALQDVAEYLPRSVHSAMFNVEEWGLLGSAHHLAALPASELKKRVLNVNLDSLCGADNLTALTSAMPELSEFVQKTADELGLSYHISEPYLANSDHGSYIDNGIPALRLCAGFDDPQSNMRYILTEGDTPDKVKVEQLKYASTVAAALVIFGCFEKNLPQHMNAERIAAIKATF